MVRTHIEEKRGDATEVPGSPKMKESLSEEGKARLRAEM